MLRAALAAGLTAAAAASPAVQQLDDRVPELTRAARSLLEITLDGIPFPKGDAQFEVVASDMATVDGTEVPIGCACAFRDGFVQYSRPSLRSSVAVTAWGHVACHLHQLQTCIGSPLC